MMTEKSLENGSFIRACGGEKGKKRKMEEGSVVVVGAAERLKRKPCAWCVNKSVFGGSIIQGGGMMWNLS